MNDVIVADKNNELIKAFELADNIVTKNYLDKLQNLKPVRMPSELADKIGKSARVFKIDKLVYDPDENNLQRLVTTYAAAAGFGSNIAMIIDSDGLKVDLYLGTCAAEQLNDVSARTNSLYKNFVGNFPGSLRRYETVLQDNDVLESLLEKATSEEMNIACVSGIASARDENDDDNSIDIQGIEKLIDTMHGNPFTAIIIANLIDNKTLADIKAEYEILYSKLVPFAQSELSFSEGTSDTVSTSLGESLSQSVTKTKSSSLSVGSSHSTAHTRGESTSHTDTVGVSSSTGVNAGLSFGGVAYAGVSQSVSTSYSHSYSRTTSLSDTTTVGTSRNITDTTGTSDTSGTTTTKTEGNSQSVSSGKSIQIRYENKTVKQLLERIDLQLERIKQSENFGVFAVAAYFSAKDSMITGMAASAYKSIISGTDTHVEAARINMWKNEEAYAIKLYLKHLRHPVFKLYDQFVTPASIVSGKELAIQMGLPQKSVNGISVIQSASFGRNIETDAKDKRTISIGNLYHMGKDVRTGNNKINVNLDVNSLAMHTFITGSTGSGKSNAVYTLLDKLMNTRCEGTKNRNIKFLVIEPAKGEYKDRFGSYRGENVHVSVYGTNPKKSPLLRINPFSFPDDIHVLEHIDRLIEIFNMCWPMYAAMPAILKDSVERAYISCGWNLVRSVSKYHDESGEPLFPTFSDVLEQINIVMNESAYSADSKGDYSGALCTRVRSLTNGIYGQIFSSDEISSAELFDENVIVDLSRVGSAETKAMIMGILVLKMQEYRMANRDGANQPLKHVTVLEEAHNLLRRSSASGSGDAGGSLMEKSVEMLANAIAEMRTYGEGFIIADQSPGLMDVSVIRNTNTKIILRLPDLDDRMLVGKAASLNDSQIEELSRLPTGVAAIYQNNWTEPILCHIEHEEHNLKPYAYMSDDSVFSTDPWVYRLVDFILMPFSEREKIDKPYVEKLRKSVFNQGLSAYLKISILRCIDSKNIEEVRELRGRIVFALFNSRTALELSRSTNIEVWCSTMLAHLEPSVDEFSQQHQEKILALIAREKAIADRTSDDADLLNRLIVHLSKGELQLQ